MPFKKKFSSVKVNNFKNILKISKRADFIKIYRATTYYNKNSEKTILKNFDKEKKEHGYFALEKNAKMITYLK